jgi:hypothetical protein
MSKTTTWYCNRDTRTARRVSDGWDAGSGTNDALPFGRYSGYDYRAFLGFYDYSMAGWTSIKGATLWLRTSSQVHVAFGSNPLGFVDRVIEAWSEGGSNGLSASNATVYPGPLVTAVNHATLNPPLGENTWFGVPISNILRDALAAGAFYGVRLSASDTSASHVGEVWAREQGSSYRAYITIEYETNRNPNTPTLTEPANNAVLTTDTPTFKATGSDPDGDPMSMYRLQIATDAGFSGLIYDTSPAAGPAWVVERPYGGPGFTQGITYYWRIAMYDDSNAGTWSATRTFTKAVHPTVSGPTANFVAPIWNVGDKTDVLTPKPRFDITLQSPTGVPITAYDVDVDDVVTTYTGSFAHGQAIAINWPTALANLSFHTVRFRARDAEGYGPWTTLRSFWVKYAQAVYAFDLITGGQKSPTSVVMAGAQGTVRLLYRTASTAVGGALGPWQDTVPVGTYSYLQVMVRLYSSGTAPVQPKLGSLKVSYEAGLQPPYSWTSSIVGDGAFALDSNVRKYGIKSYRYSAVGAGGSGAPASARQVITNLTPDTDYAFSMWMYTPTWPGSVPVALVVQDETGATDIVSVPLDLAKSRLDWTRVFGTFKTAPGQTAATLLARLGQANDGQTRLAYIDAAMVTEGQVSPPWTPALSGTPVIIDAQGLIVDGRASGLLRLFGSAGGARDIVELGPRGLTFGGDTELFSPSAGVLQLDGTLDLDGLLVDGLPLDQLAGLRVQRGTQSTAINNATQSAESTITFPVAFSGVPTVAAVAVHTGAVYLATLTGVPSINGFTYRIIHRDATVTTANPVLSWVAVGPV